MVFECFVTGCQGRVSASYMPDLVAAVARCERCGAEYRRGEHLPQARVEARAWFLCGRVRVTFLSTGGDVALVTATAVSVGPYPLVVVGAGATQQLVAPKEVITIERLP